MKAALMEKTSEPVSITEVAQPEPGAGDVLIRVEVCGLCHTDLHIADGHWKMPLLPLILGHEVVGTVEEVGEGVNNLKKDDRVGVPWLHRSCEKCELCVSGYEMFCESQDNTGYTVNGGFAELIKAPASFTSKIPAELPSTVAATLLCAGVTPYRALKESRAKAGQTVAIFGIGGLGHLAVQIARAMDLRIIAVDVSDEKLEMARSFGADILVNAAKEAPAKAIKKYGSAHSVINLVATGKTMVEAFYSLRRGGTLVVVGLPREDFTLPIIPLVGRGIRIIGTSVGTRQDIDEVLSLGATGKIKPLITVRPLSQINEALEDMRAGRIAGRCVLKINE